MRLNLSYLNNNLFIKEFSFLEKIFILIIISFLIISFFIGIPSDIESIGISASVLGIGDRDFYINETERGFGSPQSGIYGNILYPFLLKIISFVANLFGQDQYSKLWNFLTVSITCTFSIITFRLLRLSALLIFNKNVSVITCLIFMCNPYTYYFSLSGGITNYLILGVTYILWIFARCIKMGTRITLALKTIDTLGISLACIYLSFLRPNGSLFSIFILGYLCFKNIKNLIIHKKYKLILFFKIVTLVVSILIVSYNINYSFNFSIDGVKKFSSEGGMFFGYSRDLLRSNLTFDNLNFLVNLKNVLYTIIWKVTDFVSGISDIRDTHNASQIEPLMPFLFRTFTGIFILFPVNLFSLFGLITNIKYLIRTDLWIIILAALFAISPSIIGIAMSRYLIMFYTPFIIFAAKTLSDIFLKTETYKFK